MKRTLIISMLLFAACSKASVIPTPGPDDHIPSDTDPTRQEERVSIAYLKTLYKGAPVQVTGEYRISGAVVSSDVQGNFYKTLVLDDGTGGIEVKLDLERIFELFMIHTRVTVRCNGLWLGSYGGTLQLGAEPFEGYETQYLSETMIAEHLQSDDEFYGEVRPRKLTFAEIAPSHISTFAGFDGVQFIDEELGMRWSETDADTDRHLVDAAGDTLIVRTSRHAKFAGRLLPRYSGKIEGVLGCFNGKYQLVVCDSQKAEMESERLKIN